MNADDIIEILEDRLFIETEGPEEDLIASGEFDSLKFVELLLAVEEISGARISPQDLDLDDLRTPTTIAKAFTEAIESGRKGSPHG